MSEEKNHNQSSKNEDLKEAKDEKTMAIIAYFVFFLPLLTDSKKSKFVMFHVNQAFFLFLLSVAVYIAGSLIPFLGWFVIMPFGSLLVIVLFIMGIVNAANGDKKKLPLIGDFPPFFKS